MHWKSPLPLLAPVSGPPQLWRRLEERALGNVSSTSFTWPRDCAAVRIRLVGVFPTASTGVLAMRTSSDGGASFDSGATNYAYQRYPITTGYAFASTTGFDRVQLASSQEANSHGCNGVIWLFNPFDAEYTEGQSELMLRANGGVARHEFTKFKRAAPARVDGVQFFYDGATNINGGRIFLDGLLPHGGGS